MDTSAFDNKIAKLNTKIDNKQKEMAEIYKEFIDATIRHSQDWSKDQIEKHVRSNHKLTLSHNERKLKTLKIGCKDLIKEMPSIVKENLNNNKYWVHMNSPTSLAKFYSDNNRYSERLEDIINLPLSMIMGHAGLLLAKSDYIQLNYRGCDWSSYNDGTIRYNSKLELSAEMKKIIETYSEKSRKLEQLVNKIKLVEDDKEKFKAISRWKEIKTD